MTESLKFEMSPRLIISIAKDLGDVHHCNFELLFAPAKFAVNYG